MTTATRKQSERDAFTAELMRDYGIGTEQELETRLRVALAWAQKYEIDFDEADDEDAVCFGAELGEIASTCGNVRRMVFRVARRSDEIKRPADRRRLKAAAALFIYSHPAMRRNIEAGRHYAAA